MAGKTKISTRIRAGKEHWICRIIIGSMRIVTGGAFHFAGHKLYRRILCCRWSAEERDRQLPVIGRNHTYRMASRQIGTEYRRRRHRARCGNQPLGNGQPNRHRAVMTAEAEFRRSGGRSLGSGAVSSTGVGCIGLGRELMVPERRNIGGYVVWSMTKGAGVGNA